MSKYTMVVDTETTSLTKPFCYDVGYVIADYCGDIVERKHFVIEQVWHNLPLFESAYYKEKRPLYIALMRAHKATMEKWGYVMQAMIRDIKKYEIIDAYAYNSKFDEGVFTFMCDWFKCANPFDNVPIHDIWGYATSHITYSDIYKDFCEQSEYFTDTGNYKQSAEIVYRYITGQMDFNEAHMGLHDAEIEWEILNYCLQVCGANIAEDYKVIKVLPRRFAKPFNLKINGKTIYEGKYLKKYSQNDTYNFTVEEGD